jgi:uncharacterized membrane protein
MMFLDLATTVSIGMLVGVEFAVSAFVNPVLWKLERPAQAEAIQRFARMLGTVMPFWYAGSFVLLVAEAIARHHESGFVLLVGAGSLWAVVIVLTLVFLVPINNRMARMDGSTFSEQAALEHRRWDSRHRLRVAALAVAFVCMQVAVRRP